jgi:hypothetical protein
MRAALCSIVLAAACGRGHSRDEPPATNTVAVAPVAPPAAAPPAAAASACTLAPLPLRSPAPARLVAIGDLHGDLGATRAALRAAGAIDERDRWVGGALVIVQTGDVLDRGDDEQAILDLIARLEVEARAAGGAFVQLLGNHELMNAAGDFRYVTRGGLHDFDDAPQTGRPPPADVPEVARGRVAALGPGGSYARWLAEHAVVAIIGDTVFSHAGVFGEWVSRLDEVNQTARCWLDGQTAEPAPALTSDDSPVWTRAAGKAMVDCDALATALTALSVKRMVVGHTVQDAGITSACGGALWRIDVGLARHYGGPIEVLELAAGAPPKVLRGTR